MKKLYLLTSLILLCCVQMANAQNNKINDDYHPLVQEGKIWSVVTREGHLPWEWKFTTTQMAFFGDTIINDVLYKKMYATIKEYPIFPQDWILQNFMREDEDKKIWYKRINSGTEQLYYDFSLEIGDTLPNNIGYGCSYPIIVEDITYKIMHNGEERRVWHLLYSFAGHTEYWIEGIGSNFGVLEPTSAELVGLYTELLCVHENGKLIFNENGYLGTCYKGGTNGINDYDKNQIHIYPNPAKGVLYVEINENMSTTRISLINIQGQIVKCYEATATQLDISDITEGIYFIKLSSLKGNIIKKVIIKK